MLKNYQLNTNENIRKSQHIYLSLAPKSNALYMAYERAKQDAIKMRSEPVPLHLRNAVTSLMKDLHYGEGYQYAHEYEDKLTMMKCLPDSLQDKRYYEATMQGSEQKVRLRMEQIENWKQNNKNK